MKKTLRRKIKNVAYNFSDAQVKVREATSNEPWDPTNELMSEIAELTYNLKSFTEIMSILWNRLNDHGKNWRHVYKSLVLLDYLIMHGSEKVAQICSENIFNIEKLKDFQHIYEKTEHLNTGDFNVQELAKKIVALLYDEEELKNQRARILMAQRKMEIFTKYEPWDPTNELMSEIAKLTYNPKSFTEIMSILWNRLNDHGKNWRHIYKSLVLLDYLIKHGSEKVAQTCSENIFNIEKLKYFQHNEKNIFLDEEDFNVQGLAEKIVALLYDEEELKNQRARILMAQRKMENFPEKPFVYNLMEQNDMPSRMPDKKNNNLAIMKTDIYKSVNKRQFDLDSATPIMDNATPTTNSPKITDASQTIANVTSPNVEEFLTSNIIGNKEETTVTNETSIEEIEKLTDALTLNTKMIFEKKFFQENCGKIKFPDDEKIYKVSGKNFTFDRDRSFLGRGKSSVFSAKHEETRKDIALKEIHILHTRRLNKEDQDKINSFIQELEIMKTVFECNKIVHIYGFYLEGINAVICMELMSCSLKELYNRIHEQPDKFGTLSEDLLGEVSVSILDALIYCKQKDIIHRDIKPANILLNGKGEIKLCDFGESRLLENSLATTTAGTLVYFSPERFKEDQYDVRSDVWSLGIALAEIIHGRIPYKDIDKDDSDRCLYFKIQKIVSAITKEELVPKCYEEKYSKGAIDFLKSCLESVENRPKFDGLQKKDFYIRYKNANFKLYIKYLVEQVEALEKEVMK